MDDTIDYLSSHVAIEGLKDSKFQGNSTLGAKVIFPFHFSFIISFSHFFLHFLTRLACFGWILRALSTGAPIKRTMWILWWRWRIAERLVAFLWVRFIFSSLVVMFFSCVVLFPFLCLTFSFPHSIHLNPYFNPIPGVYTSNSQWSPITGGSTALSKYPLGKLFGVFLLVFTCFVCLSGV